MQIEIPYKFTPRPYQLELLKALDGDYDRAITVWHRRAGKDKTLWNLVIKKALERVGQYYYFFPEYKQGRRVIWDGIDNDGFRFLDHIPEVLVKSLNSQEMKVVLDNGSIIQVIGTDDFDKVRGSNPVGCVFSEFAYQNPAAWEVVKPIMKQNKGWAVFNSTPNGKNHFYELWKRSEGNERWFRQFLTIDDTEDGEGNHFVTQDMIDEEREDGMPEEMIQQEYYCDWTANSQGFYYLKYLEDAANEGRIIDLPYNPEVPVDTWWDIGVGDSTVIWFSQTVGQFIYLINLKVGNSQGIEVYAKELQEMPYVYGTHHFPHDMKNTEFGSGRSRIEVADNLLGHTAELDIVQKLSIDDGINAVRMIFPRLYFDKTKCAKGIEALYNYHREWDGMLKQYKNRPVHDWCLAPDTLVRSLSGWKSISDIKVGEYVWSFDENNKRIIPSIVSKSGYTRRNAEVIEVGLTNGRSITCTPDHRFLLANGDYVEARRLTKEDYLVPFAEWDNRGYTRLNLLDGSFADEHRYVWSYLNSQIIPAGMHVDHIDGNRYNNDPTNLQLLSKEDHASKTHSGNRKEDINNTPESRILIPKKTLWLRCRNCGKEYYGDYRTSYCCDKCRRDSQKAYQGTGPKFEVLPHFRVRYIRELKKPMDTYDIEVPMTGNFIAEGVVVHNSSDYADALRYLAVGMTFPHRRKRSRKEEMMSPRRRASRTYNSWMSA